MAKKKRARRNVRVKKSVVKFRKVNPVKYTRVSPRKLKIVTTNLILFILLGIVSYALYNLSTQLIYVNLFYLLSFLFGFLSLAFFIALLVLLILRVMGK
ncbi:MAG: hypothetical protein WC584_02365 [Candidatus Pacearchaeota archaeon]